MIKLFKKSIFLKFAFLSLFSIVKKVNGYFQSRESNSAILILVSVLNKVNF